MSSLSESLMGLFPRSDPMTTSTPEMTPVCLNANQQNVTRLGYTGCTKGALYRQGGWNHTYVVAEEHAAYGRCTSTEPDEPARCGLFDGLEVGMLGDLEDGVV